MAKDSSKNLVKCQYDMVAFSHTQKKKNRRKLLSQFNAITLNLALIYLFVVVANMANDFIEENDYALTSTQCSFEAHCGIENGRIHVNKYAIKS